MKKITLHIILLAVAFVISICSASAQGHSNKDNDRSRVLSEIRIYKHEILVKELSLTKEQQRDFFPLYDEMETELHKIGNEIRELEREITDNKDATDTEVENAAAEIYAQKQREGNVEMEYFEKFKTVLEPRQLLKLKTAEKKFTQTLMRQHRRLRDKH